MLKQFVIEKLWPERLFFVSMALYIVALMLPGVVYHHDIVLPGVLVHSAPSHASGITEYGYAILLWGWLDLFFGIVAWYANPLFLFAILFSNTGAFKSSAVLSLIAAGVGLQAFQFHEALVDEAGDVRYVDHLGAGFYVWELSFLLLALDSIIKARRAGRRLTGNARKLLWWPHLW